MEIHAVGSRVIEDQINKLKEQHRATPTARPFEDPIREFHHASQVEGLVRQWLTIPVEQRKKHVETLTFTPRYAGDPNSGVEPESDQSFKTRSFERWRALSIIIQEESRAAMMLALDPKSTLLSSPEVAIRALKLLFPAHDWPTPQRK